jgi:uncharacterized protein (TIGR03905 family)
LYRYTPHGTCSREIDFDVVNDKISAVRFIGGCPGNAIGLATLVEGMDVDTAINKLAGIRCGNKPTSCPDQFAQALKLYQAQVRA